MSYSGDSSNYCMYDNSLPKVGDIITFSGLWHVSLSRNDDGVFPNGLITSIMKYNEMSGSSDEEFMGTLAYPISINNMYVQNSSVYVVQWATTSSHIKQSYSLINEEWFYNKSFRIVCRA